MSLGLDDVIAAETVLSHVDGERGRLILRGHDLDAIAQRSFEGVASLLWDGLAPGASDENSIRAALGRARSRAFAIAAPLLPATDALAPIEALRLLLAALADAEPEPR